MNATLAIFLDHRRIHHERRILAMPRFLRSVYDEHVALHRELTARDVVYAPIRISVARGALSGVRIVAIGNDACASIVAFHTEDRR